MIAGPGKWRILFREICGKLRRVTAGYPLDPPLAGTTTQGNVWRFVSDENLITAAMGAELAHHAASGGSPSPLLAINARTSLSRNKRLPVDVVIQGSFPVTAA